MKQVAQDVVAIVSASSPPTEGVPAALAKKPRKSLPEPDPLSVAEAPPNLFAGTSGWAYTTWKPGFYSAGLPAKRFLPFYASRMNSVEVNYTFRKLPTPPMLEGWLNATPLGFRFSFKAPQRITHFSRLRECHDPLEEFLRAVEPARVAGKLGVLLFQLPPNLKADLDRLHNFLSLPALCALNRPRIAFEFRHESWFNDTIYARMQQSEAALCVAESDVLATPDIHPALFSCFRLRRNGGYKPAEIKAFAERFTTLAATREVYAYFKHEDEPTGALNATAFLQVANHLT